MKYNELKEKCRTPNERFGASGGADSSDTEQVTSSFALVRAFPNPRLHQAATTLGASRRTVRVQRRKNKVKK